jgi:hypothetical protein
MLRCAWTDQWAPQRPVHSQRSDSVHQACLGGVLATLPEATGPAELSQLQRHDQHDTPHSYGGTQRPHSPPAIFVHCCWESMVPAGGLAMCHTHDSPTAPHPVEARPCLGGTHPGLQRPLRLIQLQDEGGHGPSRRPGLVQPALQNSLRGCGANWKAGHLHASADHR